MFFGIFLTYVRRIVVILEPFSSSNIVLSTMKMLNLVSSDLEVIQLSKGGKMLKIIEQSCAKGVWGVPKTPGGRMDDHPGKCFGVLRWASGNSHFQETVWFTFSWFRKEMTIT